MQIITAMEPGCWPPMIPASRHRRRQEASAGGAARGCAVRGSWPVAFVQPSAALQWK